MDELYELALYLLTTDRRWLFIALIAVQALSYFLNKSYPNKYYGIRKLLFVYLSTCVFGTLILMLVGVSLREAFVSANWLAQAQVTGHQFYKTAKETK
jgi:hypothetical protein